MVRTYITLFLGEYAIQWLYIHIIQYYHPIVQLFTQLFIIFDYQSNVCITQYVGIVGYTFICSRI